MKKTKAQVVAAAKYSERHNEIARKLGYSSRYALLTDMVRWESRDELEEWLKLQIRTLKKQKAHT